MANILFLSPSFIFSLSFFLRQNCPYHNLTFSVRLLFSILFSVTYISSGRNTLRNGWENSAAGYVFFFSSHTYLLSSPSHLLLFLLFKSLCSRPVLAFRHGRPAEKKVMNHCQRNRWALKKVKSIEENKNEQ